MERPTQLADEKRTHRRETQRLWRLANRERLNAAARARYAANPEPFRARLRRYLDRRPEAVRAAQRRYLYGISAEAYAERFAAQKGVCAVCQEPETRCNAQGKVASLSVDHDHSHGAVRGLLCSRCNTAIGLFKENPTYLHNAITYLERFNGK